MSFNAKALAMRDPALAALIGASDGADFGQDASFGADYYPRNLAGWDAVGADGGFFGAEGFFAGDFGQDAPLPAGASIPKPTAEAAMRLWNQHHAQAAHTARRASLLNPNEYSTKKVERYSLTIRQDLVIGTPLTFIVRKAPDTELRAQRITTNVNSPGFVLVNDIKVANVSVTQGDADDAYSFNPNGWGNQYDIPTLSPANGVTVSAESTAAVPSGFTLSDAFPFIIKFLGPASMAG